MICSILIIPGRLPSRNDAENAARTHWTAGRKFKKEWTDMIAIYCKQQQILKFIQSVKIHITYYEQNKRRDVDNIYSSSKYILDGLVQAGILIDDSPKYVCDIKNQIEYDKVNPRVQIRIEQATQ